MSQKFKIVFLLRGKVVNDIVYQLYNNSVTETFIQLLKQSGLAVPSFETNITFTKNEIIQCWQDMYKQVQILGEHPSFAGRIHYTLDMENNQKLLNHLHQFVEEYEIFYRKGAFSFQENAVIDPAIKQLNSHIHFLECNELYGTGWIGFHIGNVIRKEFTSEQIEMGQADYFKDRLYLGYGEIGKTMKLMYQNRDFEGIRRQQSVPKKSITTEVFFCFDDLAPFDKQSYFNWCTMNKVKTGNCHYTDPRHWACWEIGEVIEGKLYYRTFDKIAVELFV